MPSNLDAHGQPFNIRFNRARRAERDLSELLGLTKGLLADSVVTEDEAIHLGEWVLGHPDAVEQWPVGRLAERLTRIFQDGRIDDDERLELKEILESVVGGKAGMILGEDSATELPFDRPPPVIVWSGSIFVFTGKFAFGTRAECQRQTVRLGGVCEQDIATRTNYLVIGTFGSRDWVHTPFGRKIEKAVGLRTSGIPIAIVAEDHWAVSTGAAA